MIHEGVSLKMKKNITINIAFTSQSTCRRGSNNHTIKGNIEARIESKLFFFLYYKTQNKIILLFPLPYPTPSAPPPTDSSISLCFAFSVFFFYHGHLSLPPGIPLVSPFAPRFRPANKRRRLRSSSVEA